MQKKLGVVFVPTPGMGHLISTVEFAKKLDCRFSTTILMVPFLTPDWAATAEAYIANAASSGLDIRFEELPHVEQLPFSDDMKGETFITRVMDSYCSPVRDALSRRSRSIPIAAIMVDLFFTSMIDVAAELGIPCYVFFTSNAGMLASMLYLPTIAAKLDDADDDDVHFFPGLPLVPNHFLPRASRDRSNEASRLMEGHGRKFRDARGVIINTFAELEVKAIQALVSGECVPDDPSSSPAVFTVGPLLSLEVHESGCTRHRCVEWLDRQPMGSVVFLCFGSMGSFEGPQVKEIALGLERSGQRFLWALRSPRPDMFRLPTDADLDKVLPLGFLERTEGRGMVWPSKVPQAEILAHPAVGGFVTHCGWNSVLESLWLGVPMLGWPLYAEQPLNCLQMVEDLGVAVELRMDHRNGGFVSSEEVERGVRRLMEDCDEGNRVRVRVKEMKLAGRRAVEEGGFSCIELERLMEVLAKEASIPNDGWQDKSEMRTDGDCLMRETPQSVLSIVDHFS